MPIVKPNAAVAFLCHVHDDILADPRMVALLTERHRHVFTTTMAAAVRLTWCGISGWLVLRRFFKDKRARLCMTPLHLHARSY